jgi:hypothetical protein
VALSAKRATPCSRFIFERLSREVTCDAKLSDLSCVIIIGFVIPSNSGEHPAFSVAKSITADDCVSAEMLTDTQFLEQVRAGFTFFFFCRRVFATAKVTCRHSEQPTSSVTSKVGRVRRKMWK